MRILVTGATGLLGRHLVRAVVSAGHELVCWSRRGALGSRALDLADGDGVTRALAEDAPDVVLHAAALAAVSDCHSDPERAARVNTEATARLASACRERGTRLVHVSTDLVFDGTEAPYGEEAEPRPLSVYGRTKAAAEPHVRKAGGLVVRLGLLFGPGLDGTRGFFDRQVEDLRAGRPFPGFEDEHRTPLGLRDASRALLALACRPETGVVHLGGPERMSRLEMGRRLAVFLGREPSLVFPASRASLAGEPRPADTSLVSERLHVLLPSLRMETFEASCEAMGLSRG